MHSSAVAFSLHLSQVVNVCCRFISKGSIFFIKRCDEIHIVSVLLIHFRYHHQGLRLFHILPLGFIRYRSFLRISFKLSFKSLKAAVISHLANTYRLRWKVFPWRGAEKARDAPVYGCGARGRARGGIFQELGSSS